MSQDRGVFVVLKPWKRAFSNRLTKREPRVVTREWLEQNRWWWRWSNSKIPGPKSGKHSTENVQLAGFWRQQSSAIFWYELTIRNTAQSGIADKVPWPLLPDPELLDSLNSFLSRKATGTAPFISRSYEDVCKQGWPFESQIPCQDPKTKKWLLDRNEPAWSKPAVFAVNLWLSNSKILTEFKMWLREAREDSHIPSPRGGETQGVGKCVWRFVEALDLRRYSILKGDTENSNATKAQTMAEEFEKLTQLDKKGWRYSRDFVARVVMKDVARYGKVHKESLPCGRPNAC